MDAYVMGYAEHELERLTFQARLLQPMTERMLRRAGIEPGMRVLDVGTGVGDVALLAARVVGPRGSVTGIDRGARPIALAAHRAQLEGLSWATFRQVTVEDFVTDESFDAVVGRYVLVHQADPVTFLEAAARCLRPGGVIAFHEFDLTAPGPVSSPEVPLWEQASAWIRMGAAAASMSPDAGGRLLGHFAAAGLPEPEIRGEFMAGGGAGSPLYRLLAETVRTLAPVLGKIGVPADEIGVETLEARLRAAVVQAGAQVSAVLEYLATARILVNPASSQY
jgi:SAM-dependent methyltransferase